MNAHILRHGAAIFLLALSVAAVSGCSAASDMINRQKTHTFENATEFTSDTPVPAEWVPGDATEITLRTPADQESGVAVILLASNSPLPDSCREAERKSAAMLTIDGAPEIYDPKSGDAHVCGEWTVMQAANGWFGWTPNAEDQTE